MNDFDEALGAAIAAAFKPTNDALNGLTVAVQGLTTAIVAIPAPPTNGGGGTPLPPVGDGQKTWTQADMPAAPDASGFYHLGDATKPDTITVAINCGPTSQNAPSPVGLGLFCVETGQHICSGIQITPRIVTVGGIEGGVIFHGTYPAGLTFKEVPDITLLKSYTKRFMLSGVEYESPTTTANGQAGTATNKWNQLDVTILWRPAGSSTGGGGGGTPIPAPVNELATFFATPAPTVNLPGKTILGSTHVLAPCTQILGAGMDVTIIDGVGSEPAGDKALFHTNNAALTTFSDMTIKNAKNPASMGTTNANAAAIKPELQTQDIWCDRVKFVGNQNGLLCSGLSGSDCIFDDNGCGEPGQTHEIYARGQRPVDITNYTFLSTTDANHGQTVQSRSPSNKLTNCNATCSKNGGGYNFPDCGYVEITGGSITKKAGSADVKLLSIGNGSATNKTAPNGNVVKITDWRIDAAAVGGGKIHFGANGGDYTGSISGTYTGATPPIVEGLTNPASVTLNFTPAV